MCVFLSKSIDKYEGYGINDTSLSILPGKVCVTFFGTTTLLFDDGETQLLVDCFFTRPSIFEVLTKKIKTKTKTINDILSAYKINRLKGIFITHSHYDHVLDAAYMAKVTSAQLYGSSSVLNIGRGGGLSENQMYLYEAENEITIGKFTVTALKSIHSTRSRKIVNLDGAISQPLKQPSKMAEYKEGGVYDILIKHQGRSILIKSSCNYIENALDSVKADVVFLCVADLAEQDSSFQMNYYEQTIGKTKPSLVVPIHWDNFFIPLSEHLKAYPKFMCDVNKTFNFLIKKTEKDNIEFRILQGKKHFLI